MTDTSQSEKLRLRVEGMDCASCATKLKNALQRMPGVSDVAVSVSGGTVTVNHDAGSVGEDKIRNQIADLGYRVARPELAPSVTRGGAKGEPRPHGEQPSTLTSMPQRVGRGGRPVRACSRSHQVVRWRPHPCSEKSLRPGERWALLFAMLVGLIPIGRRAVSAARAGTPFSIEMLMSIAAVGAVIIGAIEEAATVVFLFPLKTEVVILSQTR